MTEEERKERQRAYSRKHYQKHKAEINARKREWAREHPEKVREYNHRNYMKHSEQRKAKQKKWFAENREYWNAHCREYQRKKKEESK